MAYTLRLLASKATVLNTPPIPMLLKRLSFSRGGTLCGWSIQTYPTSDEFICTNCKLKLVPRFNVFAQLAMPVTSGIFGTVGNPKFVPVTVTTVLCQESANAVTPNSVCFGKLRITV